MSDITSLIMDDHEWFRRQFAELDDATTPAQLEAVWTPLADRLDTHAEAEETIFYPLLLELGKQDPAEETDDAIGDHNKIREAVARSRTLEVGSDEWFEAVGTARTENSEHLAEEEDEGLPDFRKQASLERRHELGEQWLQFYAEHQAGAGISGDTVDPEAFIEEHSS